MAFTHMDENGNAVMVDVSEKAVTQRTAVARGAVSMSPGCFAMVRDGRAKKGDVLAILEAMKMENEIVAPQDGTVASVNCRKGDVVNVGDLLVSLN